MVARTLDSTNHGLIWDKFHIYQGHKVNAPYIRIGEKGRKPRLLKVQKYPNPLKQALCYRQLLESGQADSQSELARLCGTPRSTVSAYLRLLELDEEIQGVILGLEDGDDRLERITEARLRHFLSLQDPLEQQRLQSLIENGDQ